MKKWFRYIGFFVLSIVVFARCEKVIDVDLNDAAPKIVIEGNVSTSNSLAEVKISMTSSYFDTLSGEKVTGAKVFVISDLGVKLDLKESSKGVYRLKTSQLKEGSTYQLNVDAKNGKYTASSKLYAPVALDSVVPYYEPGNSFIDEGYYLNVFLTDPKGIENFYRLKIYKNRKLKKSIDDFIVFNDRYVDGNHLKISLYNDPYKVNDTVTVQLITLDEGAYNYHKTFIDLVNTNPGSAAPANPVTNLSNGALGYFSAWSMKSLTIIVQDK